MIKNFNIALLGGRGYVGQEIVKLINDHPNFLLKQAFSSSSFGDKVPNYTKNKNLSYSLLSTNNMDLKNIDIVILALPNNESYKYVETIRKVSSTIIILDLSSDHRFEDRWAYRVPEVHDHDLNVNISNPGCYATAMQLSVAPIINLVKDKLVAVGISGFSGAGSSPSDKNDSKNLANNIIPYKLTNHIHEREVRVHGYSKTFFSPHVANFFRGILITSHIQISKEIELIELIKLYKDYYKEKKLVSVIEAEPMINNVAKTHQAIIGGFSIDKSKRNITICCVIDNLLKGAATQAIQNLNISCNLNNLTGIKYD
ncbi:N-acetyl-gamma-glutamyl-phosphate reductase [Gammaproteobacteria bacterium]|nr:N-acetyl-gamma-glutamyl-phosphate reductase [Gammaproteobacteria bacterium]